MRPLDDPAVAQLRAQRFAERQRLTALAQRLDSIDAERHAAAAAALQEAMRETAARLADLEAALSAPGVDDVVAVDRDAIGERPQVFVQRPRQAPAPMTTAEARACIKARLRMCSLALVNLPEGCGEAAATLQAAIDRELERLDDLAPVARRRKQREQINATE